MEVDDGLSIALELSRRLKKTAEEYDGKYTDGIIRFGATGDTTYEVDVPFEREVNTYFKSINTPCRVMTEDAGVKDYGQKPKYTFLIDPLDGSRNMRRGLPLYCSSIAVYDTEATEISQAKCAVIERFDADEEYVAVAGGGAKLNGERIRPSNKKSLDDAVLALGAHFASAVPFFASPMLKLGSQVERDERNIMVKCYGATALELALLASGKIDMIFDIRASTPFKATPKTYDIAAGLLMCQEAGAHLQYGGKRMPQKLPIDPTIGVQVAGAGNQRLFNILLNTLR
ncbi:MAG: inositol monophosphatase family protein [Candidatus Altiarchaeota archaeon]